MSKSVRKGSNIRDVARERRRASVRKRVSGTSERPRLCVFRSNKHIYVQIIDDTQGKTLVATSTLSPELKDKLGELDGKGRAKLVGEDVARLCKAASIEKIVFDRGGYLYAGGRIKALAAAAREGGLSF